MRTQDIINKVAEKTGSTKVHAGEMYEAVLAVLSDAIVEGETVRLKGIGRLKAVDIPASTGYNIQTGKVVDVKGYKRLSFKTAKAIKAALSA